MVIGRVPQSGPSADANWETPTAWCASDTGVAFPQLNARSSEIGFLTPSEAAQHFHDKAAIASQKMSLLGQTVDQRVVSYVGPLVVLAVAWFLLGELTALRVALVFRSADSRTKSV